MSPKIIYQDDSFMVVDKPAGWIVNDAETAINQPTLQSWLAKQKFPLAGDREYRSGIVHRLDKETSGILLVAKTKETFKGLQKQFKERKIRKTYLALVHGHVERGQGEIVAPVGRLPWRRDRFGVLPGGREATTGYKVTRYYDTKSGDYSLVEFYPKTGRTHQIRIHAKYLGHPIVADEFYAGRKTARNDRKWCPRLFLHAAKISFFHPKTGKRVTFESRLPQELEEALEAG